jgi:hypothetical protein
MPLGSVAVEPQLNEKGKREIWLVNKLRLLRGPSERYSDVILNLDRRIGPTWP